MSIVYYYDLTNEDLKNIGIDTHYQKAEVEQSGWKCTFKKLYAVVDQPPYGAFKVQVLAEELTVKQIEYIMGNCKCTEYDYEYGGF